MKYFAKLKNQNFFKLLATFFILVAIPVTVYLSLNARPNTPKAEGPALRGSAGDLWADVIIGDRDFGEISNGFVNPQRMSYSGGAVVDRDTTGSIKGKLWVWSGAESRIVGVNLDNCPPATGDCTATKVIGQPSLTDYAACNGDSSFQFYPNRVPATASSLCGVPESVNSFAENLSYIGMFSKNGNLYVPDLENHRVLIYYDPWNTDSIADEVIGQADFTGNNCNRSLDSNANPTASSLCLVPGQGIDNFGNNPGAGVALDAAGNLWVADNANHRVLRFLRQTNGKISPNADIAIGQTNLTTGRRNSGTGLDKLRNPTTLRFDPSGNLYVADFGNDRVLKYPPAEQKFGGMGTVFLSGGDYYIGEVDTINNGIWFTGANPFNLALYGFDGILKKSFFYSQRSVGSVGLGKDGSLTVSSPTQGTVYFQSPMTKTNQLYDKNIFVSGTFNNSRLFGGNGIAISGPQTPQMFVSDTCRILVWNNPSALTQANNGKPADYVLGAPDFNQLPCNTQRTVRIKADKDNHLYAKTNDGIYIWDTPITASGVAPRYKIQDPIQTIEGQTLNFLNWTPTNNLNDYEGLFGITPQKIGTQLFLWVSDTNKNRVFRIRDPLGTPRVDVVVGQANLSGTTANQGVTPAPLNGLNLPGSLSIDNFDNLYISDHSLENGGNHRILMFSANTFPTNNTTVFYNATATKEFPNVDEHHRAFETAFDSQNHMVYGQNSYAQRFFAYYLNPTDPNAKKPDGYFEDFSGMTYGVAFDSQDNLYVTDVNRSSVKIYKKPFVEPVGNLAPTVTITSHKNDTWYTGGVQKIAASISDDYHSVAKVEFYVDNNLISTDYFEPFEVDYNFSNNDGNHSITVKAYDQYKVGQQSITIKTDHQGPTKDVIWNSPTNGATVSGRIPVSINADDTVSGTKRVDFYVDGVKVAEDSIADSFGFWWNTSTVNNGVHTLQAKAYDQPDNVTTLSISVSVNNSTTVADPINQVYLNPIAPGTYAEYSEQRLYPLTATTQFEGFDEEVPDDLWSYVFTNGDNVRFKTSGKIDNTKIPDGVTITSVEVVARAQNVTGFPSIKLLLRTGGADYFSDVIPLLSPNSYFTEYKKTWVTNPAGGTWTKTALANAEVGVQAWQATANAQRITAVWMIVNYTTGSPFVGDVNNDGRVNIIDVSRVIDKWGATNKPIEDINQDGTVNIVDISLIIDNWK